ncbi:MAG: hypothetical protein COB20_13870 [SAR86 cluster bacterium]|uniref:Uncharacterized protein n=1 Tax=SAR86 cluster bacterium TaxID=2030880 RepID=A0A2A4WXQ5_9GAMM|nr:MAG: hypothetical protein COB20_13870 [SAR86 cluster bacterium]
MSENRRLPSALLVILIILSSQAFANEHLNYEVEILSPQASEQYFENSDIQFQIETEAEDSHGTEIREKILWRITNRFTRNTLTLSGSEPSMSFREGIYDIEVIFADSSGVTSLLAQSAFGVLRKPELTLVVTKEKRSGLWLFSSYEAHLVWTGADSEVEIYHKKACGEGFTRRQNCEAGFRKIYTGKNTESFATPYHKDDYFQVCNLGSISSSRKLALLKITRANDSCSSPVIVPRQ